MKEYQVTLRPVINVRVRNIQAQTPEGAINKAILKVNWDRLLNHELDLRDTPWIEFAEGFTEALVDQPDCENEIGWYDLSGERIVPKYQSNGDPVKEESK
jgi:hypothetical protein